MMSVDFFINNCYKISKLITKKYSTSFSMATCLLEKDKQWAIFAIYGFVRLADEIVDSFHGYDKPFLLDKLSDDLNYALKNGISTNTVLAAFADTVKKYKINVELIYAFLDSMRYDLTKNEYTNAKDLDEYIYGSADVVGLMCLKVFCSGQQELFDELKGPAQKLGSAFQKVNFLRDLKDDTLGLGRSYFPEISNNQFDSKTKKNIEHSINKDFQEALKGIDKLPGRSKLAVAIAYYYFKTLFNKIKRAAPEKILNERIRISNFRKQSIIIQVVFMYKTKLL